MHRGAKSFVGIATVTIAGVLLFCVATESWMPLGALFGLFFVLVLANKLDGKSRSRSRYQARPRRR